MEAATKSPARVPKGERGHQLAYYEKDFIVHLGVLGDNRRQIADKFAKKYGRTVTMRTVTKVWAENKERMGEAKLSIVNQGMQVLSGDALKQKSYTILDRRLTRAEKDESEIEKLRLQFRTGEISKATFDQEVARYDQLTINELVKIADMGFEHSHKGGEGQALTPEDQAALAVLTEGLKNGNPLQLIQFLNPTINANPIVGN